MCIDKNRINQIIEERKIIPVYDDNAVDAKCQELIDALGDNEEEVYKFIESADVETFIYINEIYEEIVDKFNSERLDNLFIQKKQVMFNV